MTHKARRFPGCKFSGVKISNLPLGAENPAPYSPSKFFALDSLLNSHLPPGKAVLHFRFKSSVEFSHLCSCACRLLLVSSCFLLFHLSSSNELSAEYTDIDSRHAGFLFFLYSGCFFSMRASIYPPNYSLMATLAKVYLLPLFLRRGSNFKVVKCLENA